jgi:hypothetical protein
MNKKPKCYYCKNIIENEYIQFEVGIKIKQKKYAHQNCRENSLQRKKFFETLYEILDIPSCDKRTIIYIESIHKKGFSWLCMLHALNIKGNVMNINFEKGWGYVLAILQQQLPFSYKEIQKLKKEKELQQYNIDNNSFTHEELPETEYKRKEGRLDISNLLD